MINTAVQRLRWLASPPKLEDEDKRRVSVLYHYLLLLLICLYIAIGIAAALTARITVSFAIAIALYITLFLLNRWQRLDVNLNALIFCIGNCLYTGIEGPRAGVPHHIVLLSLSIVILMSGILLNWRSVLLVSLLSLTFMVINYALYPQLYGGVGTEGNSVGLLPRTLLQDIFVLLVTMVVVGIGSFSTSNALQTAKKSRLLLEQRNRELEAEIARRKQVQFNSDRFAEILDITPDFVGITTPNGNWTYVNRAAQEFLDSRVDMLQSSDRLLERIAKLLSPDEFKRFTEEIVPLALQKGIWTGELTLKRHDGREIAVSSVIIAHRDASGEVDYIASLQHDVSAIKHEQSTRERFGEILDLTSDYISIYTLEGKWLYLNRATQEFFGSRLDINGNLFDQIDKLVPPWAVKNFTENVLPAVLKTGSWRGEIAFLDDQGQEVPISQVLIAHRDANGEVEYLAAILRNISEIKAEQQARERLARVLDATTDFVHVFTPDGRWLYVNRAKREFFGSRLNVEENLFGQLPRLVPEWVIKQFETEILPTAQQFGVWQGETAFLNDDGSELPVSLVLITEYSSTGVVDYYAAVLRDITALRQAEKERVELVLTQARMQMLRDFMSGISHDIKSPLATLKTSLYVLDRRLDDSAMRSAKLERMHEQIDKINRMVQDVLTISRLEQQPELRLQDCDLHAVTAKVVESLRIQAAERQLSLRLELAPASDLISADVNELERAIINLVENAINYTPVGGSVTVRTASEREGVTLDVQDTGIGITTTDIEHIFDSFYRSG
ncbi:MAG: PAS domain-containing sensor histidine kinase [Anaerolineae bacterium]